jgi:hypothetical protein
MIRCVAKRTRSGILAYMLIQRHHGQNYAGGDEDESGDDDEGMDDGDDGDFDDEFEEE